MKSTIRTTGLTGALMLLSLLFTLTTFAQTSGVIGIKFGFTGGYSSTINLDPSDLTGVVPITNWNNLAANVLAPQDNAARAAAINVAWNIPQDSAGNPLSGVTLTPAGFNDGWHSGGTGCATGRLMYNCWKFNTGNGFVDSGGRNYTTLTIANLPAATYDVYACINDNNGNYWGNVQANSVIAIGSNVDVNGFNGASSDPCSLGTPLHTAAGFGNPANYVKLPAVATQSGGVIVVTVVMIGGGDFGVSGLELVPLLNDPAVPKLSQDTLPTYAETVVGDQVVFTAAFSNSPAANLQWQFVNGGVTNNISGATSATLSLNNVQLVNSGFYQLEAINTTNSAKVAFSTAQQLVVGNSPAPVNNVVVNFAGQTFPSGGSFYPAWPFNTNTDLVYGFVDGAGSGAPGTWTAGAGNFGDDATSGDPTILSDGLASAAKSSLISCGPTFSGDGDSMTYFLVTNTAPSGYELTNIMVFGGWTDGGRNEQKYQLLYSTAATPTTFVPLLTADYNPTDTSGAASATRTSLVPATGVLAHNVVAVKFNFNVSPAPKNNWEGYSEIMVRGTPSVGVAPPLTSDITPQAAFDVVGGQLVMTASFSNYASLQWTKGGVAIPGATTPTLTLNNLQLSDGAPYTLVASNAAGATSSSACVLTVNPVPAPVSNIVVAYAGQTAPYPTFAPTWSSASLASSLIYNTAPGSFGNGDFTGFFDNAFCSPNGALVLTDGTFGTNDFPVTGNDFCFASIGSNPAAGNFVTYSLTGSSNGYTITNITTFGGWNDGGRDEQAYTVSYATAANPTTFIPLTSADINPVSPNGISADRVTITAAVGALATNVVALNFDFTLPAGENGWSGYSEISAFGFVSLPNPPAITSVVKSGGNLIIVGSGGSPNAGYTWLSTTNLVTPNWITNSTGTFDGSGAFSNSIPINPALPADFFRVRIP